MAKEIHHDIYVIGSQEALSSIMGSMFSPSKEQMNSMVQNVLGPDYVMITSVSLQATHMVVFVHARLVPIIYKQSEDTIATGFKSLMGNKGAVKISFNLAETSMIFINCHLHSG